MQIFNSVKLARYLANRLLNLALMKSYLLFLILSLFIVLEGCHVAEKALNRGDYDTAMMKAAKKLTKDKQNGHYASLLNQAYMKLYQEDMDYITFQRKQGTPDGKLNVLDGMNNIRSRYNSIKYLLPLGGYDFPVIADEDYIAAKNDAAEYLLVRASQLVGNNNKADARQAFQLLQRLNTIFPNYKNAAAIQQQAMYLGSNYVLMRMTAPDNMIIPADFQQRLLSLNVHELNSNWMYFTPTYDSTLRYDYHIIVKLVTIAVMPEQLIINNYLENAQIEDGFEYVLDAKGNVKKDSLGNDIKRKRYRTISCMVSERRLHKEATVGGFVDIYNTQTKQLMKSIPLSTVVTFDAITAIANGDLNALSPRTRQLISTPPPPVPNDFAMLYDAAEKLKPIIMDAVRQHRYLFN
jgi:hypothetical protein